MKIFLSWSGDRSRCIAETLRTWLPDVISFFEPWISSEDIEKGARWIQDIGCQLEDTDIGIVCLTPENIEALWILFESGALAKALDRACVCTYLYGLRPGDLKGPLVQFMATQANKADTFRLLATLNEGLAEKKRSDTQLKRLFDRWWPGLEKELTSIPSTHDVHQGPRTDRELLEELLDITRQQIKGPVFPAPFRVKTMIPFDHLFIGKDVYEFAERVQLVDNPDDPNAVQWAHKLPVTRSASSLEGLWCSRWYEEGFEGR